MPFVIVIGKPVDLLLLTITCCERILMSAILMILKPKIAGDFLTHKFGIRSERAPWCE